MSRLLVTNLPLEYGETVNVNTFNTLIRTLELNLRNFDPDNTRQIDDSTKNIANFNTGALVWNTNNNSLEVYTGNKWVTITTPTKQAGLESVGSVGRVSIKLAGATSITDTI